MSKERDNQPKPPLAKGSTRTNFLMTKAPANSPRGKLHRLASTAVRVGHEMKKTVKLDRDDMTKLRKFAQRGVDVLRLDNSRGARLIVRVCYGLDLALGALLLIDGVDVAELGDNLTVTLIKLEVAEGEMEKLQSELDTTKRELVFERKHNEVLRRELAEHQVRAAGSVRAADLPAENWEEPTRNSTLTDDDVHTLSDPNAFPDPDAFPE
jgi:hypothetical protein